MDGDIGVDAGEEIGVERGSDFGTTAGRQASRHADSMPGTFARQMMPALRVYPEWGRLSDEISELEGARNEVTGWWW
jgi:hypothetical protein